MTSQNELDANARGGTELLGERLEKLIDPTLLNQFQVIRSRFRGFDEDKPYHILWEHDLPQDPESQKIFADRQILQRLDAIVFVSHWQRNAFIDAYPLLGRLNREKCTVIRNAIEPFDISNRTFSDTIRLIYTPTPHRGLQYLVPAFETYCDQHPDQDIHLDVYSSFKLYGWSERDAPFQELFDRIKRHNKMTYHGTVSNEKIREALLSTDIFFYPSVWQETSCLCLIEAMSADCLCVTSDLAALPETSGGLIPTFPLSNDPKKFQEIVNEELEKCVDLYKRWKPIFESGQKPDDKKYIDTLHSLNMMKICWETLFNNIRGKYGNS